MAYAIMRNKKLTGLGAVAASLRHNFRERETLNADGELTPRNTHLAARSVDQAMGRLRELLPEKRRKDAVLVVEYLCTASPEWWKTASTAQQEAFFVRSRAWIEAKFDPGHVVVATIHRDETSPHLSAYVVPLTVDGRLSAKEFIGNRTQMSEDQTSYARCVADLGLERGIQGSKARHQTVKTFYAQLEQPVKVATISPETASPRLLKKGLLSSEYESPQMVAKRLTGAVNAFYAPAVERAKVTDTALKRNKELEATLQAQQKRLAPVLEAMLPLNQAERATLAAIVKMGSEKLLEKRREQEKEKQLQAANEAALRKAQGKDRDDGPSMEM